MKSIVAFLTFVVYVQAISYSDVLESEWNTFRQEFGKSYETLEEEQLRRQIFNDNKQMIDKHNKRYLAADETYEMGVNEFTDLLPKEFESLMLESLNTTQLKSLVDFIYTQPEDVQIPSSIDWRVKGAVTKIKNQGGCGSCWAFSAVGSLEGQQFVKTRQLTALSEQNVLDCSSLPPFKNSGCRGGWPLEALHYVMVNNGIDTEMSYPYEGIQKKCRFNRRNVGATVRALAKVKETSESDLAAAVAIKGPVSVAIDATYFQFYHSGVFNNPNCTHRANHAVVVVGYGRDNTGGDYWIVKNSWGNRWGEAGYIRMSRNRNNQCWIASNAIYPLV